MDAEELIRIVVDTDRGEQPAWSSLVVQYQPMMRAIARGHRLNYGPDRDRQLAVGRSWLPLGRWSRKGIERRINKEARRSAIAQTVEVLTGFEQGGGIRS